MRSFLVLISSLLLLLAGCQSLSNPTTGTTTVSGQVVESVSRQGVPQATVQVWHESTGGGYGRVGSGYSYTRREVVCDEYKQDFTAIEEPAQAVVPAFQLKSVGPAGH